MNKKYKFGLLGLLIVTLITALWIYLHGHTVDVLQPAGQIGHKERQLMIFGVLLSVIVVMPTFALAIFIIWKYREGNTRPKKYSPDWDHSRLFESIWWGIPIAIITVLSVVAWNSAHALDPYKPLVSTTKPLTIQVVALDWKWLFIYPEQRVASVNAFQIPVNTPVNFEVTSDTVMNSFWVPQLGGQIYAMPGMVTELHLMANKTGTYNGSSANISGNGFSGMTFTAQAGPEQDFNSWVNRARHSSRPLTTTTYAQLAKPSTYNPVTYYSTVQNGLYNDITMKYMMPMTATPSTEPAAAPRTPSTYTDHTTMPGMGM